MKNTIKIIEQFAKQSLTKTAHDFKHVDRVRYHALKIAKKEHFKNLPIVIASALLHDIGLPRVRLAKNHGKVGAQLAKEFLTKHHLFNNNEIAKIYYAIKNHNTNIKMPGQLLAIIRDADMLDALGNIGIVRAFTSKSHLPDYNPQKIKGETWELTNKDFDKRFAKKLGVGPTIIDQINFQISFYNNLNTKTAKEIAKPLVKKMRKFILGLEKEIHQN